MRLSLQPPSDYLRNPLLCDAVNFGNLHAIHTARGQSYNNLAAATGNINKHFSDLPFLLAQVPELLDVYFCVHADILAQTEMKVNRHLTNGLLPARIPL